MDLFNHIFYSDNKDISWWAMCIRGILVFLFCLSLIRLGGKRMFSSYGSFDIVISILLGSILAKAVVGNAKFFPTLICLIILVLLHWMLSRLTVNSEFWGTVIKGKATLLVKDGKLLQEPMKRNNISENDILEALRFQSNVNDISKIKEVYLERNGKISIILSEGK